MVGLGLVGGVDGTYWVSEGVVGGELGGATRGKDRVNIWLMTSSTGEINEATQMRTFGGGERGGAPPRIIFKLNFPLEKF